MDYQQATVYFYSGTGNSYRVAVWVADALAKEESPVLLLPIDSAHPAEDIGDG